MLDGLRDQPLGDQRLPEADLVGDQEPLRSIFRLKQPLEGVLDRGALELLEPSQDVLGRLVRPGRFDRGLAVPSHVDPLAACTGSHTSRKPSGKRSRPSGVRVRSSTKRWTSFSPKGSRANDSSKASSSGNSSGAFDQVLPSPLRRSSAASTFSRRSSIHKSRRTWLRSESSLCRTRLSRSLGKPSAGRFMANRFQWSRSPPTGRNSNAKNGVSASVE